MIGANGDDRGTAGFQEFLELFGDRGKLGVIELLEILIERRIRAFVDGEVQQTLLACSHEVGRRKILHDDGDRLVGIVPELFAQWNRRRQCNTAARKQHYQSHGNKTFHGYPLRSVILCDGAKSGSKTSYPVLPMSTLMIDTTMNGGTCA